MGVVSDVVSGVVKPFTDLGGKVIERKTAKDSIRAKVQIARDNNETTITATDAEWERMKVALEPGTWKDEYITVVITSPIVMIMTGAVWAAFTLMQDGSANTALLDGTIHGINELNKVGVPMGDLMKWTVLAGLGLKVWRSK